MKFEYSSRFKKQYKKLPASVKNKFSARLDLFIQNDFGELLNNHKLHGDYSDCRSINITGDFRLIYRKDHKNIVRLLAVGTHSELFS